MNNRRSAVPLKALAFHLTRTRDIRDLKLISDAFYAVCSLNFKDPELLESLCMHTIEILTSLKLDEHHFEIRSIVSAIGQSLFFHKETLDAVTKWYAARIIQGTPLHSKDMLSYLLTTSALNYEPEGSEPIYKVIQKF